MVTSGSSRQSGIATPVGTTLPQYPPPQIAFKATNSQAKVVLDGPESKSTKAFVQLGHGTQGLLNAVRTANEMLEARPSSTFEAFTSLFDSRSFTTSAAGVLKGNFPHTKGSLPPLVANLTNLLDELGKLPSWRCRRLSSTVAQTAFGALNTIGIQTGVSVRCRHRPPHFRCGYLKFGYNGVSTILRLHQMAKSV